MTSAKRIEVDVCVIGAGPAGTTLAARLGQLGHEVCLVERCEFPPEACGRIVESRRAAAARNDWRARSCREGWILAGAASLGEVGRRLS